MENKELPEHGHASNDNDRLQSVTPFEDGQEGQGGQCSLFKKDDLLRNDVGGSE